MITRQCFYYNDATVSKLKGNSKRDSVVTALHSYLSNNISQPISTLMYNTTSYRYKKKVSKVHTTRSVVVLYRIIDIIITPYLIANTTVFERHIKECSKMSREISAMRHVSSYGRQDYCWRDALPSGLSSTLAYAF